jgi:hypothetical protein
MNKRHLISTLLQALILGILFLTTSCCTKKGCADNWFWVEFHNFSSADLDTVILCQYIKNTNYSVITDSTRKELYYVSRSNSYLLDIQTMEPDFDYKIYIVRLGKAYKISDIVTKKAYCNSCLMVIPSDKYIRIQSYQLDGQTNTGERARIYK